MGSRERGRNERGARERTRSQEQASQEVKRMHGSRGGGITKMAELYRIEKLGQGTEAQPWVRKGLS